MTYRTNISAGAPPLLWSEVQSALEQINNNFVVLGAALSAEGITPVDFTNISSNISASVSNSYRLGSSDYKWKSVHLAAYIPDSGDNTNGVWIGSAHIKGISSHIELPLNSTCGGALLIDPDKTFFKSIDVDHNNSIVAQGYGDTIEFLSGGGISMTVDSAAESITFNNTGLLSVANGTGISTSTASGVATITNTGVISVAGSGTIGSRISGRGIHVSSSTGNPVITNTGVLEIQPGSGSLAVSTDAVTGIVTITNTSPAQPAFQQVEVNGDPTRLVADSTAGVLKFTSGQGITLTKNTLTDTVTFTVNPVFDLNGSIFGNDSALIVDANDHKVYASNGFYGNVFGNVTGDVTGNLTGNVTGNVSGTAGVATTVTLVSTNTTSAAHYLTFVDTATGNENVRTDANLTYNPGTNTLTLGTVSTGSMTITGSTFTTVDSSAMTFVSPVAFDGTVVFGGRISIGELFNSPLRTVGYSSQAGTPGEICWDANSIYVCVAANTWKHVALTAF